MLNYATNIYQQAFVVLDSSYVAPSVSAGNIGITILPASYTDTVPVVSTTESLVLRDTFSSAPTILDLELTQKYQELGQALSEITELEEGEDWHIDPPVCYAARYVASELMRMSIPTPRIFNHGPRSVVFNWSIGVNNLYLTISADRMSALISSPERIQRRIDYSSSQMIDSPLALLYIESAYFGKPVERRITGTTSNPLELTA
jgi:hypothetical protein